MQLFVNRDSPTPLHDQLVAQVGQLVAAGSLAPGERLPSIRGLAARLGVHHLTVLAAYRTLAARGLLEIREGSGVRVAALAGDAEGWREGLALRAMAAYFVGQARARGHDEAAIRAACEAALAPSAPRRVVVVNHHPDLQALYLHELGAQLDMPMAGATPDEVRVAGPAAWDDACMITSLHYVAELRAMLGEGNEPVAFRLRPAEPWLAEARALPEGTIAAVVSGSERFLFLLRELLAGALPEERLLGAELADEPRVKAVLKHAGWILADAAAAPGLAGRTRATLRVHRLLADDALVPLTERLPPEAFRGPTSARR